MAENLSRKGVLETICPAETLRWQSLLKSCNQFQFCTSPTPQLVEVPAASTLFIPAWSGSLAMALVYFTIIIPEI